MTKTKKEPAIPLKDIMAALDKKDRGYYNRLSDEQKKAFVPWMMMRYASSAQGRNAAQYLFMINELVNKNLSDISKHPELQWLLMTAAGSGKIEFHPYIKPPNSKKKKDKISEFIYKIRPGIKRDELELLLTLNTKDDLKRLAQAHGYDDNDIDNIFGN